MLRSELLTYVLERFGAEPEYLWERYPDTCIFRHQSNRKWFGVLMDVQRARLACPGMDRWTC